MNTRAIRSVWVGRVIDERFVLLKWLGGTEWSGTFLTQLQSDPPQKAVIKLISADSRDAEAHIAGRAVALPLSHPHLMHVFHHGRCEIDDSALVYTVTEYADEILSQVIPERPLTAGEAREMLGSVLDALSYLHGKGLVHAHLKPSNILVVNEQLKLSADTLHVAGAAGKDTPALTVHDAPEIMSEQISPAADVWSLGVTLVEALSQQTPFWSRSSGSNPVVPESIPQPFADIARACLRVDPARRCTLKNIKARLESSISIREPAASVERTVTGIRRMTGLVAAVLLLLGVIIALQMRFHKAPSSDERASGPIGFSTSATQTSQGATVKGEVLRRILPDVPPFASRTIQGKVDLTVRLMVDTSGHITSATCESPQASRYFARLALAAAQQWAFKPAQVNGRTVPSVWIVEFQFMQDATGATPTEVTP
jgi:serine/threonine-protein kinase